jgi:hypothetical protein
MDAPDFPSFHGAMFEGPDAALHPDFSAERRPAVPLIEYADGVPINSANLMLFDNVGFDSSRSGLSCHHVMIAQAIGGSVFPSTSIA